MVYSLPSERLVVSQTFELCESLNAVAVAVELHKLLDNKKAAPEAKVAVLEALGDMSKAAGAWCSTGCCGVLDCCATATCCV